MQQVKVIKACSEHELTMQLDAILAGGHVIDAISHSYIAGYYHVIVAYSVDVPL